MLKGVCYLMPEVQKRGKTSVDVTPILCEVLSSL